MVTPHPQCTIEQNIKIATGTINKKLVTDINLLIKAVVIPESFHQQNFHHELTQNNSPQILISHLHSTISSKK